jgi:hypothetical protein
VLKCGGGRALTKQASEEATLKCHMPIEEGNKMVESTTKMLDNNALVICGAGIDPEQEGKPKRTLVKNRINSLRSRLGRIMRRLYDLESGNEPEKPLKIDFDCDLYQMENF